MPRCANWLGCMMLLLAMGHAPTLASPKAAPMPDALNDPRFIEGPRHPKLPERALQRAQPDRVPAFVILKNVRSGEPSAAQVIELRGAASNASERLAPRALEQPPSGPDPAIAQLGRASARERAEIATTKRPPDRVPERPAAVPLLYPSPATIAAANRGKP